MGVQNFLVEGVSGTGKTAVCDELRRRGFSAVHGDRELAHQADPVTGAPVVGVTGVAVHDHHLWREDEVRRRAADPTDPVTFFCGGARNVERFVEVFDQVFVLTVDAATLERRLDARPADEWAGRSEERALVRRLHADGSGTPAGTTVDATRPVAVVVDDILRMCGLAEG